MGRSVHVGGRPRRPDVLEQLTVNCGKLAHTASPETASLLDRGLARDQP